MKKIITYFYHINESKRDKRYKFFHRFFWDTRWSKGYNLEISSGRALRFSFQRGDCGDSQETCQLSIGFFFFSLYFTFPVSPRILEHKKCIATWDNDREFYLVQGREYGFYFYQWAFVWFWHGKTNESSSKDPWWMHQYIHIDEWFLGKDERTEIELLESEDIHFKLGGKDFKIDSIKWKRCKFFRTFIPFALYHRTRYFVDIRIEKPPMFSGKGENSWDCGDNGTFAMSQGWNLVVPTWSTKRLCEKLATEIYVDDVLKSAGRYGGASCEDGISKNDEFEYMGALIEKTNCNNDASVVGVPNKES